MMCNAGQLCVVNGKLLVGLQHGRRCPPLSTASQALP